MFNKKEYQKKYRLKNKEILKEKRKKYNLKNKEKRKEYHKKYYLENPEKVKEQQLKCRYNITLKEYNYMFLKQKSKCAICDTYQSEIKHPLGVDHNHETGQVRELLCFKCNNALGLINESMEIAENLVKYLKYHSKIKEKEL